MANDGEFQPTLHEMFDVDDDLELNRVEKNLLRVAAMLRGAVYDDFDGVISVLIPTRDADAAADYIEAGVLTLKNER